MYKCPICGKELKQQGNHLQTHLPGGFIPWNKGGGHYRPESLLKMSVSQKERFKRMPIPFKGMRHTEETKTRLRWANFGKKIHMTEEVNRARKLKISNAKKGHPRPPHVQTILAQWREKLATDHILRQEIERKALQAVRQKPTSLEKQFIVLCIKYSLPFRYVGNGEIWIGKLNPDFININGRKEVIEILGNYWHTEEETQKRINSYKKYGFNCVAIWEDELKDENLVLAKLGVK